MVVSLCVSVCLVCLCLSDCIFAPVHICVLVGGNTGFYQPYASSLVFVSELGMGAAVP